MLTNRYIDSVAWCQVSQLTAKAVVGITADPARPGQLTIELLRSADTVLVARPKIARRAVASDCLGAAGPYSVRGQGRPETQFNP